jgi:hypothetical protein
MSKFTVKFSAIYLLLGPNDRYIHITVSIEPRVVIGSDNESDDAVV